MRKLVVLVLVVVLPAFAFAELQIGGVGMYTGTMAQLKAKDIGFEDFTFGAEARLKLSLFQAGVSALYYPEVPLAKPAAVVALTDVGLSLDLLFLRFGLGLGPNLVFAINDTRASKPFPIGLNMKGSIDVNIGNLSLGIVGFYYLDSIKNLGNVGSVFKQMPWLGLTAMFKLF